MRRHAENAFQESRELGVLRELHEMVFATALHTEVEGICGR